MSLSIYGWNSAWAELFEPWRAREARAARIVAQNRGEWETITEQGLVAVELCSTGELPVTGDWVALHPSLPVILDVLPRQTVFERPAAGRASATETLAANAEKALIVMGLDGDYNPRRLDRFLALAFGAGAAPVVFLNKADAYEREDLPACPAPVLHGSALHGEPAAQLAPHFAPGETVILLGSSGAGKSTLVNRLLSSEVQPVQAVREHDSRGRHTTTARQLIATPQGWILMDTPGLREVGLTAGAGLEAAFPEIEEYAGACRFRDCRHDTEPGCAVRGAVDAARLAHWQRLTRERMSKREIARLHREFKRSHRKGW